MASLDEQELQAVVFEALAAIDSEWQQQLRLSE